MISRVAVFCGSKSGDSPVFVEAAAAFGTALAAAGLDLVYGGAQSGLMGAVATAVLAGGRSAIGVVPRGLSREEFAHPELTEHHLVDDMNARKALMAAKADAFVALPGGFGTLDELFEALTLIQTDKVTDFPVILVGTKYWSGLTDWVRERLLEDGKISPGDLHLFTVTDDPQVVVSTILDCRRRLGITAVEA